jgi:hypothetical protein
MDDLAEFEDVITELRDGLDDMHFNWAELEQRIEEESEIGVGRRGPKRSWRVPIAALASVAAAVVIIMVASPTSLTSAVLAYAYPDGTYTYDVSYLSVPDPESVEAKGTLSYTVEEGSNDGLTTVEVQADFPDVDINCGHPTCPEDRALFTEIPAVRYVFDSSGAFVQSPAPDPLEEFPEPVLPDPLPGSNLYVGLPFGFGPPFPDHPLQVGDSWTTSGPPPGSDGREPQFSADHTIVEEQTIAGRETMVIRSDYQSETGGGGFPVTTRVTVWFDVAGGIIVRAELDRSMTTVDGDQIGATEIVVELVS